MAITLKELRMMQKLQGERHDESKEFFDRGNDGYISHDDPEPPDLLVSYGESREFLSSDYGFGEFYRDVEDAFNMPTDTDMVVYEAPEVEAEFAGFAPSSGPVVDAVLDAEALSSPGLATGDEADDDDSDFGDEDGEDSGDAGTST